jgi:hypothetical protein
VLAGIDNEQTASVRRSSVAEVQDSTDASGPCQGRRIHDLRHTAASGTTADRAGLDCLDRREETGGTRSAVESEYTLQIRQFSVSHLVRALLLDCGAKGLEPLTFSLRRLRLA